MHTDIRRTYESVHEDIMKRLECDLVEQSSYLNDIMPLIHNIDNLSTKELRAMFQKLAHNWMTSDERKIFANDSDNRDRECPKRAHLPTSRHEPTGLGGCPTHSRLCEECQPPSSGDTERGQGDNELRIASMET